MRHHRHNIGLNLAIRGLHDELKSLVLTCAANFPKEPKGGLKFLADVVDLQGMIANYNTQVLVFLFQSASSAESASVILRTASKFIAPKQERRPETAIDKAVRKRLALLLRKMRSLGEEELRALNHNEDIPEALYYLSTLEQALCWYADRYLARLTGELAKMET